MKTCTICGSQAIRVLGLIADDMCYGSPKRLDYKLPHHPEKHHVPLQSSQPDAVVYSNVNRAALKLRQVQALIFWYCVRATDSTGCGLVDISKARALLGQVYCTSSFYKQLGSMTFWRVINGRIAYMGLLGVCLKLGISNPGFVSRVPLSKLKGAQASRAWVYATSVFRPADSQKTSSPMSRLTTKALTGIDRRQQLRLEKRIHVKHTWSPVVTRSKHKTALVMENGQPTGELRYLGKNNQRVSPQFMVVTTLKNGKATEYIKQRRLGNSCITAATKGGRSLANKVRKSLKQHLVCLEGVGHRRYFTGKDLINKVIKAKQNGLCHLEPFSIASIAIRPGRVEWEGITCSN
jgi:hypothetical protein